MSQNERLLQYLESGQRINPLESWSYLGIYRLAARINDLRAKGHNIQSGTAKVKNRFGEECRVSEYWLEV